MEDELQQMDASLTDATRLVHQTNYELTTVRQKTAKLTHISIPNEEEETTRLTSEKNHLTAVCESMLELEQYRNLHAEVSAREHEQSQTVNGTPSSSSASDNDTAKIAAAHALANEQARRRELSRELVQAQAMAGMSEKGEMYKRLIAASMGVGIQDVAALVPDVLRELEVGSASGKGVVDGVLGKGLGLGSGKGVVVV
ncbi:MAG: hypothetical protein Q9180_008670 [Flavoplaca navasiana]